MENEVWIGYRMLRMEDGGWSMNWMKCWMMKEEWWRMNEEWLWRMQEKGRRMKDEGWSECHVFL